MAPRMTSDEIHTASLMHLGILDEFIRVVESKLEAPMAPFLRDSLSDLLGNLAEQRETYTILTDRAVMAA
ncbi:hypothetical protein [Azospirillum sp. sgz301742]